MSRFNTWSIALFLVPACAGSTKQSETLKQAATLHNETMKAAADLEEWLAEQKVDATSKVPADSLVVWDEAFEAWEKKVVEVPGNEEHHEHKNDEHHHDHKPVEVTDDQMLVIQ